MLRNWQENNRPPVPPEFEKALQAAFKYADRDGDGAIGKDELPGMLNHLARHSHEHSWARGLDADTRTLIMRELDVSGPCKSFLPPVLFFSCGV